MWALSKIVELDHNSAVGDRTEYACSRTHDVSHLPFLPTSGVSGCKSSDIAYPEFKLNRITRP